MAQTVTHPRAIELLFEDRTFACLEALMQAELPVGQLAKKTGLALGSALYRVQQLSEQGLVQVVREEKRSGRAIKHYRATSEAFYVPFSATHHETVEDLWWKVLGPMYRTALGTVLKRAEAQEVPLEEGGILIQTDPEGGLDLHILPRALPATPDIPDRPVSMLNWDTLTLPHDQARVFKQELQALVQKYQGQTEGHEYAFFSGLILEDTK
ncbi:winged helix-turn-helix domain-containing protein [Deinococcus roseus]|uniref:HTH iclR-type domain-containing protein n=1 Tax=Deinococcus roseus TaxID=392414 RepID=A0ABQ2DFN3_9DEIO|nr:winged helix-turn-helix domain-containing protein [Deinococcus roseus]GGJ56347.1 hypothetical protein GCM10008938_48150 [Deinococcus roseus]